MATEQASPVTDGSDAPAKWGSWITALVGLWVLVSPFVLTGDIGAGTAMWSNVAAGLVALVLAGYAGYSLHAPD